MQLGHSCWRDAAEKEGGRKRGDQLSGLWACGYTSFELKWCGKPFIIRGVKDPVASSARTAPARLHWVTQTHLITNVKTVDVRPSNFRTSDANVRGDISALVKRGLISR